MEDDDCLLLPVSAVLGTESTGTPQDSTTSSAANPTRSIPLFVNLAIRASVPASRIVLVITLCAERLYSGMMRLPPLAVDEADAVDETEAVDANDDVDCVW